MESFEIYDQYYVRVRQFILSMVKDEWIADDLIQETFVRVQKSLVKLQDPARLSSWIFRIAYNLCKDHFRNLKKDATGASRTVQRMSAFPNVCIQKELEQNQMGKCVQDKINLLPEQMRTVLVLKDVLDFRYREIAEILDVTTNNVKVRLHRARKRLKIILEENCDFERDERDVLVCLPR